mmetsp:Transcript_60157/g.179119  ORF Transcript_60157/g.179119 Transcript_60157/m.179119 type:complete len:394 (+) Transcript_60157:129-1310(+)
MASRRKVSAPPCRSLDWAALQAIKRSRTEVVLLSTSAILPHSSATVHTPQPAAAPAGNTRRQRPSWRRSPPSHPPFIDSINTMISKAAKTSSSAACSAMRRHRSSRVMTRVHPRNLNAAETRSPAADTHQGRTRTQPLLPRRPPSTQSDATDVVRTPNPKKTNMALLALMQRPRQEASTDTAMNATALGRMKGVSPRCELLRYLHNMISAVSEKAMKISPRKAMTMSGRISVRMLGLLSPSRAWRSLKHNWMYGQEANQDATIKAKQSALPNHTGTNTTHQEGSDSDPSAAAAETTRAPCEKMKANLPATSRWCVRCAVLSWADGIRDSREPSGSKSMDSLRRARSDRTVFQSVVDATCGSFAAVPSPNGERHSGRTALRAHATAPALHRPRN